MKNVACSLVALALLFSTVGVCAAEYPKMNIRGATANPAGDEIQAVALDKFKEILEKESGGNIRVTIYYGGSMGDEQANVKQCRSGELEFAQMSTGNLTPFAPAAGLFYLPYIFPTMEDAEKVFSDREFIKKLADLCAEQSRTRPLAWLHGDYRMITNSKKPIHTIEDLKGLKIRVPAVELQLAAFRAWGVEPHPLAWTETFNGLQQGVIDGQENPHSVNRAQKFWEVQKYITPVHYLVWTGPILVSEKWYRKLDDKTRALVDRAAQQAVEHEWKWAAEQEANAYQQCVDHGMIMVPLEDEQVWMERARSIWPEFYDKVGGKELVDEVLAIIDGGKQASPES